MASAEERTEQLNQLAHQLKMDFKPVDDWGLSNLLEDFKLFRSGGAHKITNMLMEKDDMETMDFRIFDFAYTVSTGKSSVTVRQTVLYVHSNALALPQFWMKPESIFHKLGIWLGLQRDINFIEYPEFSKQYFLKSKDEAYTRATMQEQVLRYFTIEKNWYLEGLGYMMLFYKQGVVLDIAQIKELREKGRKIYSMLLAEPI